MATYYDQILDSPSKNSYIGSYYKPPSRLLPPPKEKVVPVVPSVMRGSSRVSRNTPDVDSKAVVDALRALQEKIRRLEAERKQAESNVVQFSQASNDASAPGHSQSPVTLPEKDTSSKKELVSHLQSAEARCQILEKQLVFMRKMVEKAEKDKSALAEKQAALQNQTLLTSSDTKAQQEKLDKLEQECLKLTKTQTAAEMKMAALEQKLLEEEHERKLVQEKAEELQKELDVNLRLLSPATEEVKPKKKKKKKTTSKKPTVARQHEPPTSRLMDKQMPFVAGTSTSPSHSVRANMQNILHLMKHHQPQLCERVRTLHRSGCGAKKSLCRALSGSASPPQEPGPLPRAQSLESLSDLLLALQDELGQMSFEQQELMRQIDLTHQRAQREDLERELEGLVTRMEEKGIQISKLRRHQQTVHKLTQATQNAKQQPRSETDGAREVRAAGVPLPSPVKDKHRRKTGRESQKHAQPPGEGRRVRSSLKQDDLSWET